MRWSMLPWLVQNFLITLVLAAMTAMICRGKRLTPAVTGARSATSGPQEAKPAAAMPSIERPAFSQRILSARFLLAGTMLAVLAGSLFYITLQAIRIVRLR